MNSPDQSATNQGSGVSLLTVLLAFMGFLAAGVGAIAYLATDGDSRLSAFAAPFALVFLAFGLVSAHADKKTFGDTED